MKCNYCGTTIPEENKICNGCGQKVEIIFSQEKLSNEEIIEEELEKIEQENIEEIQNKEQSRENIKALIAIILSIIGILFPFGFILNVIALILSVTLKNPTQKKDTLDIVNILLLGALVTTLIIFIPIMLSTKN